MNTNGLAVCARHLHAHLSKSMSEQSESLRVTQILKNSTSFICECGKPARWFIRPLTKGER